ncbi:MAG: ribosome biogenesis GTPase Der [Chlamydiae bacterium]|nr:ribosome biogenesis GTPase Der [Chlamydiota bacterium]
MSKLIKIALVGRPNVGKSSLFNRICKKRISIVDEAEGVTRDRLYTDTEVFGHTVTIIDTGGIDPSSKLPHNEEVRRQAEIAIEEADSIILVVDGRVGITALDKQIAQLLLQQKKKLTLAVNKIDGQHQADLLHEFYPLAIENMVAVSAVQGFQIAELLESAIQGLTFEDEVEPVTSSAIRVAVVGRPNVGKSTFMNYILQEERCVVSPVAGTTRDSIDADLFIDGVHYTFIDTAGIRRKSAEHDVIEKFAAIRTERAIERADVCIFILDALEGITAQEKRIATHIEEHGKGCILLFNKWDLVKGFRMEHCLKSLHEEVSFLKHCPTFFVSAKQGRNLDKIFSVVKEVYEQTHRRITTGQLNKFMEKAIQKCHPPMIQGRRLRIFYMAQVEVHPPKFVLFVNKPELMSPTYKKYIVHQFREMYGFAGVPVLFMLKGRDAKTKKQEEALVKEEFSYEEIPEEEVAFEEGDEAFFEESLS